MTDNTRKQRQQRRRAALNEAARRLGYDSWAKLETAVINGQAHLKVLKDDPTVMWYGIDDIQQYQVATGATHIVYAVDNTTNAN